MGGFPAIAIVLPGEAMWGAFQTGFALELKACLAARGHGDSTEIDLAVGSSSGSLVATVAAAGATTDHELARQAWIRFGEQTGRKRELPMRLVTGRLAHLYSDALAAIFEGGLVDTERAFTSRTAVVVTAAQFNKQRWQATRETGLQLLRDGLQFLAGGIPEITPEQLAEEVATLLAEGRQIFTPYYFSSKPWPADGSGTPPANWFTTQNPKELRLAVEASSRIPLLYGPPIQRGGDTLIDGVYGDNAPVEIALQWGAEHVFVVTSSRHGNVFERPIQSLALRQAHSTLHHVEATGRGLRFLPVARRAAPPLEGIGALRTILPRPAPVDLNALRQRYPRARIHVAHPPADAPRVSRFFESRPHVLGKIYDLGIAAARQAAGEL